MTAQVIGTNPYGHAIWGGSDAERTATVRAALDWFLVFGGDLYESDGVAWNTPVSGGGSGGGGVVTDKYYADSTARIADEANVTAGKTATDLDTGHGFMRTDTGWRQIISGGAVLVNPTVVGLQSSFILNANFAAGSGDAAGEFITGIAAKEIELVVNGTITSPHAILVAYSSTDSDQVLRAAALDALRSSYGTPDVVLYDNTAIITVNSGGKIVVRSSDLIRTLSIAAVTADYDVSGRIVQ
jgi:hypothetical protein